RLALLGAEPAGDVAAGRFPHGLERSADLRAFIFLAQAAGKQARDGLAMGSDLPVPAAAFVDHYAAFASAVGVHRRGRPHAVAIEGVHDAEHADAVAVLAVGPRAEIRVRAATEAAGQRSGPGGLRRRLHLVVLDGHDERDCEA